MNVGLKNSLGWTCFARVVSRKWNTIQASGVLLWDSAHHQSHGESYRFSWVLFLFLPPTAVTFTRGPVSEFILPENSIQYPDETLFFRNTL